MRTRTPSCFVQRGRPDASVFLRGQNEKAIKIARDTLKRISARVKDGVSDYDPLVERVIERLMSERKGDDWSVHRYERLAGRCRRRLASARRAGTRLRAHVRARQIPGVHMRLTHLGS